MRKFAVVGIVGVAMASSGFVGVSGASDEIVVARLVIESVPEADTGYAANPARGVELARLLDEVDEFEASLPLESEADDAVTASAPQPLGSDMTGAVAAPTPHREEKMASAATTATPVIPAFESTKNIAPEAAPARRKVVRVNDKKRIRHPVPIVIGAFR